MKCVDQIEENVKKKIPDKPGYISSIYYNSELQIINNDIKKKLDDLAQINDVIKESFKNNFPKCSSKDIKKLLRDHWPLTSDNSPPSVPVSETSLTKQPAHKQRIMAEFSNKPSSSNLQSLTKYQRWQTKHRNVTKDDVIMMSDKKHTKNKFCLGKVDSVNVDNNGKVRKCDVKNKIASRDPAKYPSSFKHVERNVRSQALLIKAEEREDFNIHDLYQDRFKAKEKADSIHSEEGETIEEEDVK